MAQGMPHLPREGNPIAFEDEESERIRLGLGTAHDRRTGLPSHSWTRRMVLAVAVLVVVAAVIALIVLVVL